MNLSVMLICSSLAVIRYQTPFAIYGLLGVVFSQALGYGLVLNLNFIVRALSICGGLLILLVENDKRQGAKMSRFVGLPSMNSNTRIMYLQLAGRVLLVGLFFGFILGGEFSKMRLGLTLLNALACAMVLVGFKAKYSVWVLITILSFGNILLNNWWNMEQYFYLWGVNSSHNPQRDHIKYGFFQNLSVVGGFLLLAHVGAGILHDYDGIYI
jgi:uncharacterized membrane protein YphA (DoxX/SURF4 family)